MDADFVGAMKNRSACAFAGAGVSAYSTANDPTSTWIGLIEQGRDRASELNANNDAAWVQSINNDIARGRLDVRYFGFAADRIEAELGGPDGVAFRQWLADTVGQLQVVNPDLIDAIIGLDIPIVTTNYDTLIEQQSGLKPVTWMEPGEVKDALSGRVSAAIHLHGVWNRPDTVVFSSRSYQQIIGSEAAQFLQTALLSLNTTMFIGVGAGYDDPNISGVRVQLLNLFGSAVTRHPLLCRDRDSGALAAAFANDPLRPVVYGDDYDDLPAFIRAHIPSEPAKPSTALAVRDDAIDLLRDRIRSSVLVTAKFIDIDSCTIDKLLIPPVLLPTPAEQMVATASIRASREHRIDPGAEVERAGIALVAADRAAGLTSTLMWMLDGAATHHQATPVLIDTTDLRSGNRPLVKAIRRSLGQSPKKVDEPLGKLVIAIDNLAPDRGALLARVCDDLSQLQPVLALIGCEQGDEAAIARQLDAHELSYRVRFVGRMQRADIRSLVRLIDPNNADKTTDVVAKLTHHGLDRTPLTVALLASVIAGGAPLTAITSQTSLLDNYLHMLLGRGSEHQDSRFSLDSGQLVAVLATLAGHIVTTGEWVVGQAQAVTVLERFFERVGWSENARGVLNEFERRRVLRSDAQGVSFAHNTLLCVCAAHHAVSAPDFRSQVFGDALGHSQVLQHYAALAPTDIDALKVVAGLVAHGSPPTVGATSPFATSVARPSVSVEQLADSFDLPSGDESVDTTDEDDLHDWIESLTFPEHTDRPFPEMEMDCAPKSVQLLVAVDLASTVLRDCNRVEDLDLKTRVLRDCLTLWGVVAEQLASEPRYMDFSRKLADGFIELAGVEGDTADDIRDRFPRESAVLSSFGGVASTLATRKLLVALGLCLNDPQVRSDPRASVMATVMAFSVQEPGWAAAFEQVAADHRDVRVVRHLLVRLAILAYQFHPLADADKAALERMISSVWAEFVPVKNERERARVRDRIVADLRRSRIVRRRRRLNPGETVLTVYPSANESSVEPD